MVKEGQTLSIIVPAFNEEGAVANTLEQLKREFPAAEIILVDDCSSDATLKEACSVAGVTVLRHRFNRGYGAALKTGMARAKGEAIAWFDADGEHRPEDLKVMVQSLRRGSVAAVIGRRPSAGQPRVRFFGKLLLRLWAFALGVRVDRDLNCGLRVFHAEAIRPYLSMLPDRFSASTTSTLVLLEKKYPIEFCDIRTDARVGESKVRLRHGFDTLLNILRITLVFGPLRLYGTIGAVLLAAGLTYGVIIMFIEGAGFPTFGLALIMGGMVLLALGLISDQISRWRLSTTELHPMVRTVQSSVTQDSATLSTRDRNEMPVHD